MEKNSGDSYAERVILDLGGINPASKLLNVSKQTIRNWVREGSIPQKYWTTILGIHGDTPLPKDRQFSREEAREVFDSYVYSGYIVEAPGSYTGPKIRDLVPARTNKDKMCPLTQKPCLGSKCAIFRHTMYKTAFDGQPFFFGESISGKEFAEQIIEPHADDYDDLGYCGLGGNSFSTPEPY